MSFLSRMFSADYRAAVAAEAAGNLELAAERFALAGRRDEAVRMHLARASRAVDRTAEIAALRDALHWASEDPALRSSVAAPLGKALLARARAEGIATERDRERIREAAALLADGGEHRAAGEALEAIGDYLGAAAHYGSGGLVDRVEFALGLEEGLQRRLRALRDAFSAYQLELRLGNRDAARDALRECISAAGQSDTALISPDDPILASMPAGGASDYRRLLDELESTLLTGGRVVLRRRGADPITVCGNRRVVLGRDALCDLALRSGGVSRRHAEIEVDAAGGDERFSLRDAGSRNGTLLGGLPLSGRLPLRGDGEIGLGDDCRVRFEVSGEPSVLRLRIEAGLDRGVQLAASAEGDPIDLSSFGVPAVIRFRNGRPLLGRGAGTRRLLLGGETVGTGEVQLVRGDRVDLDGVEIEVE